MASPIHRRRFLISILVGSGAAAAALAAGLRPSPARGRGAGQLASDLPPTSGDGRAAAPGGATGPAIALPPGSSVGACVVERVGAVHCGAVPVVLRDPSARRFQVDVLRRNPAGTPGIANTAGLSLFLANEGHGATPTHEQHGLAVLGLAGLLGAHEARVLGLPGLLTLEQRLAEFPRAVYELC
jgi:hypothetical protein